MLFRLAGSFQRLITVETHRDFSRFFQPSVKQTFGRWMFDTVK